MPPDTIATRGVHHVTLTVSDVERSYEFYSGVLGFQKVADFGPRVLVHNGSFLLALTPGSGPGFDETRVGLDHLSLAVDDRNELDRAAQILENEGIRCGDIEDLADFEICVLMIRDPDNIQIELTAPYN